MAEVSPFLVALIIVIIVIVLILIAFAIVSRSANITPSSTPVVSNCTSRPFPPTNLLVTNPQGDLVILTWSPSATTEQYTAYVGTSPGFDINSALGSRTTKFTSTSFSNLNLGAVYYLKVRGSNKCGISDLSSEVSIPLQYVFPVRFFIEPDLNRFVNVCDTHTNIFFPSNSTIVSSGCAPETEQLFREDSDQTIRQSSRPNVCLTRGGGNSVSFAVCNGNPNQEWFYDNNDKSLCSPANPDTQCMNLPVGFNGTFGNVVWGPKDTPERSAWYIAPV